MYVCARACEMRQLRSALVCCCSVAVHHVITAGANAYPLHGHAYQLFDASNVCLSCRWQVFPCLASGQASLPTRELCVRKRESNAAK